MGQLRFDNAKKRNRLGFKRGFYASLAVCIIAIAIISWTNAANNLANITNPGDSYSRYSLKAESTLGVDKAESGVRAESVKSESKPPVSSDTEVAAKPENDFYMAPVSGRIYKEFSMDTLVYSPTYNDFRVHRGIDIECEQGAEVKSISEGEVLSVRDDSALGMVVEVRYGTEYTAYYCGINKKPPVKQGDKLKMGDVIGAVDIVPSEITEQAHLHFELKKKGVYTDPVAELRFKLD